MKEKKSLKAIFDVSEGFHTFYEGYVNYLGNCLKNVDVEQLGKLLNVLIETRKKDRTVFFAGNGGSAATSSHFSQDLAEVGKKAGVRKFKSLSLTDNVSQITAAGNDYGYEHIFTSQLEDLFGAEDVLILISASGNSTNLVYAAEYARQNGGTTVALVGFAGGKLAEICDVVVHIPTEEGEYGPAEDGHLVFDHVLVQYLMWRLKDDET